MLDRMRFGRHTVRDVQTLSKLSSLPPKVYEDGITPTYLYVRVPSPFRLSDIDLTVFLMLLFLFQMCAEQAC